MRILVSSVLGILLGCGHAESPPPAPEAGPRVPAIVVARAEPLPPLARELLAPRMHRNRDHLEALHASVMSVDYDGVRAAARAILAEPKLSRPVVDEPTLNDEIPERFFELQDRMVLATRALEVAAEARDA